MKKWTQGLLISIAALSLCGVICTAHYTHTIEERLSEAKRNNRSDITQLNARIHELESEWTMGIWDRLDELFRPENGDPSMRPVDGQSTAPETDVAEPEEPSEADDTDQIETDGDTPNTDAVTLPTHQTPETQPPSTDAVAPAALYVMSEHEGVIGIFDATGELMRVVNVFVMTLPDADREALSVGIPAYSWAEMLELIDRYQ